MYNYPTVSTPGAGFKMPKQTNPALNAWQKNIQLKDLSDERVVSALATQPPVNADPMAAVRALTQASAPPSPYTVGPILQTSPGSYSNIVSEGAYVNQPYLDAARRIQEQQNPKPPKQTPQKQTKEDTVVRMMVPTPFGFFPVSVNMTQLGSFLGKVPKVKPSAKKAKGAKTGTKSGKGSLTGGVNFMPQQQQTKGPYPQENLGPNFMQDAGFFINPLTGQPIPSAPPMFTNPMTGELIR